MKIPEETINKIIQTANIVSILSRYIRLKSSGSRYWACCPFHHETAASFSVDPYRNFWYCFGCGLSGNVFTFLMKMEGMNFVEAVKKVAQEVNIEIEWENVDKDEKRDRLLELLDRVASFYNRNLLDLAEGQRGRDYLQKRKISRFMAEKFRLGFAPGQQQFLQMLKNAGFTLEEGVEAGVCIRSAGGIRELLGGRLIFPICDFQGRVVAMGGRAVIEGQLPKYINSPETKLYSKRFHLYGLNVARGQIARDNKAILVEGYLDVISMHQVGVGNCIASLGTALTKEQATLLKRYAQRAVLAYDGDKAGAKAILRGDEVLEEEGIQVNAITFPEGEDPDSLANKGREAVEQFLSQEKGVVQFQMEQLAREIDISTPEGKEEYIDKIWPFLSKIQDQTRRVSYEQRLCYFTGLTLDRVKSILSRYKESKKTAVSQFQMIKRRWSNEEKLFNLCTLDEKYLEIAKSIIDPEMIKDERLKILFAYLWERDKKGPVEIEEFKPFVTDMAFEKFLLEIYAGEVFSPNERLVTELATSIKDVILKERMEKLRSKILPRMENNTLEQSDEDYIEYTNIMAYLRRKGIRI